MFKRIKDEVTFTPESKIKCIGDKACGDWCETKCEYCYLQYMKKEAGMERVLIETEILYDKMHDTDGAKWKLKNHYYFYKTNVAKFVEAFHTDRSTVEAEQKATAGLDGLLHLGGFPYRWQCVQSGNLDRVLRAQSCYDEVGWKTVVRCRDKGHALYIDLESFGEPQKIM